eukprot:12693663-Prorocentrum_lima.AAC.1
MTSSLVGSEMCIRDRLVAPPEQYVDSVARLLASISPRKSPGLDDIGSDVLRQMAPVIAPQVAVLFYSLRCQ